MEVWLLAVVFAIHWNRNLLGKRRCGTGVELVWSRYVWEGVRRHVQHPVA